MKRTCTIKVYTTMIRKSLVLDFQGRGPAFDDKELWTIQRFTIVKRK